MREKTLAEQSDPPPTDHLHGHPPCPRSHPDTAPLQPRPPTSPPHGLEPPRLGPGEGGCSASGQASAWAPRDTKLLRQTSLILSTSHCARKQTTGEASGLRANCWVSCTRQPPAREEIDEQPRGGLIPHRGSASGAAWGPAWDPKWGVAGVQGSWAPPPGDPSGGSLFLGAACRGAVSGQNLPCAGQRQRPMDAQGPGQGGPSQRPRLCSAGNTGI